MGGGRLTGLSISDLGIARHGRSGSISLLADKVVEESIKRLALFVWFRKDCLSMGWGIGW